MTEELLTTEQAAEYLQYSARHVSKLAREGSVPSIKRGRRYFFRKTDLAVLFTETDNPACDFDEIK